MPNTSTKPVERYIDANDRFSQGLVLDLVGDEETAKGICRMLSIQWLIECTKPGAVSPEQTLQTMKSYGPVYFKQIGQSQKAYASQYGADLLGWFGSMRECLQLASKTARDAVVTSRIEQTASSAADLPIRMTWAIGHSTTQPASCLISLMMPAGGHCIAAVRDAAQAWHVFDPNFGVAVVTPPGQTLADAAGDIWSVYGVKQALVAPVV